MYCKYCGAKASDTDINCMKCGKKLERTEVANSQISEIVQVQKPEKDKSQEIIDKTGNALVKTIFGVLFVISILITIFIIPIVIGVMFVLYGIGFAGLSEGASANMIPDLIKSALFIIVMITLDILFYKGMVKHYD